MIRSVEEKIIEKAINELGIEAQAKLYSELGVILRDFYSKLGMTLGIDATATVNATTNIKETGAEEEISENKKQKRTEPNHKVSDVTKLIKCEHQEGKDEVLFLEKRKDSKHLWFGQIRINNNIRNFSWSNELPLPVVYGIENMESLKTARDIIVEAVKAVNPKELELYDAVPDDPAFGGFSGRFYYDRLSEGEFLYVSPVIDDEEGKPEDVICKGYINDHAFIIRRDLEIRWRHYNYVFKKQPFEMRPSKGYDEKEMRDALTELYKEAIIKFRNACNEDDADDAGNVSENYNNSKENANAVNNNVKTAEDIDDDAIQGCF